MRKVLAVLFGLAAASSLGFGASQALATPAADDCEAPHGFYLSCPTSRDCSVECAGRGYFDGGSCLRDCCECAY